MKKWIIRIIMLAVLAVFLFSVTSIVVVMRQYEESDQLYSRIAEQYTTYTSGASEGGQEAGAQDGSWTAAGSGTAAGPGTAAGSGTAAGLGTGDAPPIAVDFQGLKTVNGDVCGWIYCEGTPIDYPVVQGEDNALYLRHNYEGSYNTAGSIFVEASNRPGFADSNTIIYGHHMKNGSMFACLDHWADQAFYEAHPVMWLLTPEQDYKIVLFSGYTTSATSDTYTIFQGPGGELDDYLARCREQSDFRADVEPDGEGRYVLLSTCAYVFDNARYVLHGMLVPVDSAGEGN